MRPVATLHLTVNNTSISTTALDGLLFTITRELEWAILQQQWQLYGNTDQQRRMRFSGHAEPHGEPDAGHANRNLAGKLLSIPTQHPSASGTNTIYWYTSLTGGNGSTTAPTPSTSTTGFINVLCWPDQQWMSKSESTCHRGGTTQTSPGS